MMTNSTDTISGAKSFLQRLRHGADCVRVLGHNQRRQLGRSSQRARLWGHRDDRKRPNRIGDGLHVRHRPVLIEYGPWHC